MVKGGLGEIFLRCMVKVLLGRGVEHPWENPPGLKGFGVVKAW